jgi:hypothetical protein
MRIRAAIFAGLLVALSLIAAPANAANQISGTANFAAPGKCPPPPDGFADFVDYPPIDMNVDMNGSLDGCWYTNILTPVDGSGTPTFETTPGGVYLESGEELFVGSLNGGPLGTFRTTYKFEAKLNSAGLEIKGRCQHKIVAGSGTGGFLGASGRVDFKDIIEDTTLIEYHYRGHISLP